MTTKSNSTFCFKDFTAVEAFVKQLLQQEPRCIYYVINDTNHNEMQILLRLRDNPAAPFQAESSSNASVDINILPLLISLFLDLNIKQNVFMFNETEWQMMLKNPNSKRLNHRSYCSLADDFSRFLVNESKQSFRPDGYEWFHEAINECRKLVAKDCKSCSIARIIHLF